MIVWFSAVTTPRSRGNGEDGHGVQGLDDGDIHDCGDCTGSVKYAGGG